MNTKLSSQRIILFRSLVLALAIGFWIYQFTAADYTRFGIQFRFLTNWTITFNMIVAAQMLRRSLGHTDARWDGFVGLVIIMNMAVVVQYWRLMFMDPTLVQSDGGLPWYQEYYLHALGPLLMWIDAFCILGAFRKVLATCVFAVIVGVIYPMWIELIIQPMNTFPVGDVTNGLPYPFLNDLEFSGRIVFYGISTVANFVFIGLGVGLAWWIARRV